MRRFNFVVVLFHFAVFGIEENYCSESNLAQSAQSIEPQAQAMDARGFIETYIYYEGVTNIFYWLFDWYQKKPGLYWYKHYRSFGYRTCLLSNRFYFDFYVRTWINIPVVAVTVLYYYYKMNLGSCSPEDDNDLESKRKEFASNIIKCLLCLMFVPSVDLNICFGDNFYLVIGFRDIIILYFGVKVEILDKQIKNYKKSKSDNTQSEVVP